MAGTMVAAERWQQNLHDAARGSHAQLCDESFNSPSCAAWSVLAFAGRAGAFDLWTIGGRRRLLAFSSSASDCIHNSQGINCRLHIVNSHDVSPVHRRNDRARDCSVKTLVRGSAIKKLSDERFSRGA